MRKVIFPVVCLLILGTAVACKKSSAPAQPLTVSNKQLKQQSGADCDIADTLQRVNCARVQLSWPVLQSGNSTLQTNVNQWALNYMGWLLSPQSETPTTSAFPSVDAAVKAFFDEHSKEEPSAMTGGWTAESDYRILLNNGKYLTLEINGYSYRGGAHGTASAAVAGFDANSGKQLALEDLVTDRAALIPLAEDQFHETRYELFHPTDGNPAFAFDTDNPFALPHNYGPTLEGLYCHYLPYEVGPYAIGSTQMTIPYASLGTLAKIVPEGAITTPPPAVQHPTAQPSGTPSNTKGKIAANTSRATTTKKNSAKAAPVSPKTAIPGITLKQNGDVLLNGKKIAFDDLRKELQAALLKQNVIPNEIPLKTIGQTGMGMRAETRTVISESIAGAKWVRKKAAIAALNTAVGKKLETNTQLDPGVYHSIGSFAYISGRPRYAGGAAIDYSQTAYASDRHQAWFSDNAVGLLQYSKGSWKLLAYTIGVDKAPVATWTKKFGAPKTLFK